MEKLDPKKTLQFYEMVLKLKHSVRMGWEYCKINEPERIAGHMYAMAIMTLLIDDNANLDRNKCMQLALVHDLAECIVGDITPHDDVPVNLKHKMERDAMKQLSNMIGGEMGANLLNIYTEYEEKLTPEAKFVKDLDRFDMIFTALNYEKRDNTPGKLQEFFDSTEGKFEHPFVRKLVAELNTQRQEFVAGSNRTENGET